MKRFLLFICLFFCFNISSQNKTESYISNYSDLAIKEMKDHGIPASVTLGQAILETGSGKSRLAIEANNHFGIKCHGWDGKKIYADDDELDECFRKYNTVQDSYRDRSRFLLENKRYHHLFELNIKDYKGWSRGLKKSGYATSVSYDKDLINLIEKYNLSRFDDLDLIVSDRHIIVSNSYGFPFLYGIGLYYLHNDNYILSSHVKSSFIYSGINLGVHVKLFKDLYSGGGFTIFYHNLSNDCHSMDVSIDLDVKYFLNYTSKQHNKYVVNLGGMFLLEKIRGQRIIPSVGFDYLLQ